MTSYCKMCGRRFESDPGPAWCGCVNGITVTQLAKPRRHR